jgi:hypothetical protein
MHSAGAGILSPPMAVPFPSDRDALLTPPDRAETEFIGRGLVSAVRPATGLTELQATLVRAVCQAMTGFDVESSALDEISAEAFAEGLRRRNEMFRTRIVHLMLIAMLVLVPLPEEVWERVSSFAAELGIDDEMLHVARRYVTGSLGLALIDFERNGYSAAWTPEDTSHLHASNALEAAWDFATDDPALAAQWADLEGCRPGSVGRRVFEFYRARGFAFPGRLGSAPPLLAQHDWVHVLADFGTTVESELEVFTFIARANADPRAFSLVAMVISLFETGYLSRAAGLFQYDRGHLSRPGMATRLADAMRRGALTTGDPDFLRIDWFAHADTPLDELRREFGIVSKSPAALESGSVGPWEVGGISPFQQNSGRKLAEAEDRPYEDYGAVPA